MTDPPSTSTTSERNEAVARLHAAHHPRLVRLASLLGAHDPEAAVAEAFHVLLRKWHKLHSIDAALAYLRAVVCNQARDQIKQRQRQDRLVKRLGSDPATALPAETDVARRDDEADDERDHQKVRDALDGLPPRQREVLVLRYWDNLSEKEIADALGIADGTVKTHAFRGKASMEKTLDNAGVRRRLEKLR